MASLAARYGTLLAASLFGLPGLLLALSVLGIHILSLKSFSVPMCLTAGKDSLIRAPWPDQGERLEVLSENHKRVNTSPEGGGADA